MVIPSLIRLVFFALCHARPVSGVLAETQRTLILNGTTAIYPYYAFSGEVGDGFCGGSLISESMVLSSAHCNSVWRHSDQALIGLHDRTANVGAKDFDNAPEKFAIRKRILHPNFNFDTFEHDLMIIVLDGKSTARPVCLNRNRKTQTVFGGDKRLFVMGFGQTSYAGKNSNVLLETDLQYISRKKCRKKYMPDYNYVINYNMLCADGSKENKDACRYDSGGPLIMKRGSHGGQDLQIGVISWGVKCAAYPGVFSNIGTQFRWIERTVEKNGGKLPSCHDTSLD